MSVVVNSCGLLINCLNMFPLEFLFITKGAEAFIYEWRFVIKGMLAAIGIILIIKQAPVAIGYVKNMPQPYHIMSIIIVWSSFIIKLFIK